MPWNITIIRYNWPCQNVKVTFFKQCETYFRFIWHFNYLFSLYPFKSILVLLNFYYIFKIEYHLIQCHKTFEKKKETFLCMCLKTGRERMRKSQAIHDLARNVTKLFLTLILYPLYICSMPFLEIKMFSKEIEKVERYLFYQCYTFLKQNRYCRKTIYLFFWSPKPSIILKI